MPALKLFAYPVSQPSRAVMWLLKIKNVDYEFVNVDLRGEFIKSEEFLALNPNGYVPVLQDGDFSLYEGNAILAYLAEKFEWEDMYPKEDIQTRAKINEYLHWHHMNARLFTTKVMRPLFKQAMGGATPDDLAEIDAISQRIEKTTALVEKFLVNDYVARTPTPTVADIALYCEYDQLDVTGLLDLAKFPKTQAWMERMKALPFHDEIRVPMHAVMKHFDFKAQPKP